MSPKIRVVALCVFRRDDGTILVGISDGPSDGRRFYRPLGGGVEFGESAEEAVAREIQEELGAEIHSVRRLGVLDQCFTFDGKPKHEVAFIFDARFADESFSAREHITGVEANGLPIHALWILPRNADLPLFPNGLTELLDSVL